VNRQPGAHLFDAARRRFIYAAGSGTP